MERTMVRMDYGGVWEGERLLRLCILIKLRDDD